MRWLLLFVPVALFGVSTCAQEVLFRFFPKEITLEAMRENGLTGENAESVASVLWNSDNTIIREIEDRASKMDPNPLLDDGSPEVRAKLFKEVATDVFMKALTDEGFQDTSKALQIFDAVQEARFVQFQKCQGGGELVPTTEE